MDPERFTKLIPTRLREDFDFNVWLLRYSGLWPPSGDAPKTRLDRFQEVATVSLIVWGTLVSVVLIPLGALESHENLATVFECVVWSITHLMVVAKAWTFYSQPDAVKRLTARLVSVRRKDRMAGQHNEERRKIVSTVQMWINVLGLWTVWCIVSLQIILVTRIPDWLASGKHAVRIWFPVDPYSSPTYEILFTFWILLLFLIAIVPCCVDGYLAVVYVDIVGQLKLLCHDLGRIREDAIESVRQRLERYRQTVTVGGDGGSRLQIEEAVVVEVDEVEVEEEMSRLLGEYVDRYHECMEIVHDAEKVFNASVVMGVVTAVVSLLAGILFAGIKPVATDGILDPVEIERKRANHLKVTIMQLSVVFGICGEFATGCFLVDMISEASEQVRNAVYGCDWFTSTESFKRSMRIIMSCANQPLVIKAAGFVPMTLETFLAIMNLAYSYYTTMNSMLKKASK